MEDRAISLNAVHDLIATWLDDYLSEETREALETIDGKIDDMPSVTPQPKKGHWIERKNVYRFYNMKWKYECSECGLEVQYKCPYCYHCGADMRGEKC